MNLQTSGDLNLNSGKNLGSPLGNINLNTIGKPAVPPLPPFINREESSYEGAGVTRNGLPIDLPSI